MHILKKITGMQYPGMLLFGLFFIGISCHPIEKLESKKSSVEFVDNEIWKPQITITRKEKTMIKAKSKKLFKNNNEATLLVGNVEIDFFNDAGEHISMLYSDSARINEQNNNLNANGNVYVVSDSGYTLTTSEIIWNHSYKMIIAEDSVMFTTSDGDTLYGVGFESDSDLEEWRIFKPIGITRQGI